MAVYHFTYHAYRSWLPDRRQGYVFKGKGILPQDREMANVYEQRAAHDAVTFDEQLGWTIIDAVDKIVRENDWLLYEAVAVPTHVHLLVGWKIFQPWKTVSNRLKRGIGLEMSRFMKCPGPWFSRGRSRKRVKDRKHFDYLLNEYLPSHGNIRWTLRDTRTADMHPQLPNDDGRIDNDSLQS
jgi:hypothetical protein